MNEIKIAKSILNKRIEKGLTQEELANYFGVTKASVSKWEKGQSYPDITLLPRLASFFDMSIDELMGYTPQMSKAEIRTLYQELSAAFEAKPFDDVMAEVRMMITKYYSCYPLLLQIVILLLNHCQLAKNSEMQTSVLEEALVICQRVKAECPDLLLTQQANSLEAMLYLTLQQPNAVIDLLHNITLHPINQDEMLLASAYEMKGDTEAAKRTLQITSYQYVLSLVGCVVKFLPLYKDDSGRFKEILHRGLTFAEAFHLQTLHPNAFIQLTLTAAFCFSEQGDYEQTLVFLKKSLDAFDNFNFPAILQGDEYFDLLDEWFQDFALGDQAPRSAKLVKENFIEILGSPVFAPLFEMPEYKDIVTRAERFREES